MVHVGPERKKKLEQTLADEPLYSSHEMERDISSASIALFLAGPSNLPRRRRQTSESPCSYGPLGGDCFSADNRGSAPHGASIKGRRSECELLVLDDNEQLECVHNELGGWNKMTRPRIVDCLTFTLSFPLPHRAPYSLTSAPNSHHQAP